MQSQPATQPQPMNAAMPQQAPAPAFFAPQGFSIQSNDSPQTQGGGNVQVHTQTTTNVNGEVHTETFDWPPR